MIPRPSESALRSCAPDGLDVPARARRRLLLRLTADYPTLPGRMILNAVAESEQLIALGGDGVAERETVEIVARHNLALVLAAMCAAKL